ncbi:hypothetical protein [Staphylococcus phage PMBT8]|nr:hypothetical protein [Staphylococcus phage PMBT8]
MNKHLIETVDLYLREQEDNALDVWNGYKWVGLKLLDTYGVIMQDGELLTCVTVSNGDIDLDININLYDMWENNIYKDEIIEIQDLIGYQIGQQFFNWNLSDEVDKYATEYNGKNDYINVLTDIVREGCKSGIVSNLTYDWDILFFYNRFKKEIDSLSNHDEIYRRVWVAYEEKAHDLLIKEEEKA